MSPMLLTAYVLVWPIIASGVLLTLCTCLVIDIKEAKRTDTSLV